MNPFFTTTKIKAQEHIPVDYTFDTDQMGPASNKAVNDIKQVIGSDTYTLLETFLESADFDNPDDDRKKVLKASVLMLAAAIYNMAMYHQFIWLMLRVSSNSVTVMKGENEQTLTKGQMIEARESLLEFAYSALNDLVEYITANKANVSDSEGTEVWTESEQYTETQGLLFAGFRDFAKYSGLAVHAAFYYNSRHILAEVVGEKVTAKVGDISKIIAPDEGEHDKVLIAKLKRATAREVTARACIELPVNLMPGTIRQTVDREMYATKRSEEEIRNGIGRRISILADQEWDRVDMHRAEVVQDTVDTEKYTVDFDDSTIYSEDNKTGGIV